MQVAFCSGRADAIARRFRITAPTRSPARSAAASRGIMSGRTIEAVLDERLVGYWSDEDVRHHLVPNRQTITWAPAGKLKFVSVARYMFPR
jgi:hypothetical protein